MTYVSVTQSPLIPSPLSDLVFSFLTASTPHKSHEYELYGTILALLDRPTM